MFKRIYFFVKEQICIRSRSLWALFFGMLTDFVKNLKTLYKIYEKTSTTVCEFKI